MDFFATIPLLETEPLTTPHTVFKLPAEESDCLLLTDVGAPLASVFLIDMANGCILGCPMEHNSVVGFLLS